MNEATVAIMVGAPAEGGKGCEGKRVVLTGDQAAGFPTAAGDPGDIGTVSVDDNGDGKLTVNTRFHATRARIAGEAHGVGPVVVDGEGKTFGYLPFARAAVTLGAAVKLEARRVGPEGNALSAVLADPAGNNAALGVVVAGNKVTVNLATDGAGAITSTAAEVAAAINADADAFALMRATAVTGAGVVAAVAETSLAGGANPSHDPNGVIGVALVASTAAGDEVLVLES